MYFQRIFYFLSPACTLLDQLRLLSRDLGETLIIVECCSVSIHLFQPMFYFATRNSCSVFGRETLSMYSLTLGLIVTRGCFQVVLKEFGRVSSSWGYWNVFFTFWQKDIFSVFNPFWRRGLESI